MKISNADLRRIMEHIKTTNSEMGVIKSDISSMKTDIEWLKHNQRWSLGLSFSTLVGLVIMLVKILVGG